MADEEEDEFPVWLSSSEGGGLAGKAAQDASFDAMREVNEALKKIHEKPQRVVCKTMWDIPSAPSLVWAAPGHVFKLEDLAPRLAIPVTTAPHPLIPRLGGWDGRCFQQP
jgi:hypothetical protein